MLKDLIRYTELADRSFVEIFKNTNGDLAQAEFLFSHILNAQHIWLSRINKTEQLFDRFYIHPKEHFEALLDENIAKLNTVLKEQSLDEIIAYKIATGDSFESSINDILFHVVNHSTYHRGQIATQFKQAGITPPITDYVFLKRQGEF